MRNFIRASKEPTLDELLNDEIMVAVVRSAGMEPATLRQMLTEVAARLPAERFRPRFDWTEERGFQPTAA